MFYQESLRQRIDSRPALSDFNRQVLRYMLQDLSQRVAVQQPTNPLLNDRMITHNLQPSTMESKEEMHAREFAQRQREYDALLKRPEPPAPKFGDTVKDEVITNMDELIQQQMKMREQIVIPPPPPQQQQVQPVNRLHIHNEEPTKTVTWKEPVIELQTPVAYSADAMNEVKSEVGLMREQIKEMQSMMRQLYELLLTKNSTNAIQAPQVAEPGTKTEVSNDESMNESSM